MADINQTAAWVTARLTEVGNATNGGLNTLVTSGNIGTYNAANVSGVVAIANGGTGANNATDAVANLGALTSSDVSTAGKTGSYNDLLNKPTIPVIDQTYSGTSANGMSGVAMKPSVDELQDIRIGADGITYASAGAAVRGQVERTDDHVYCIENTIYTVGSKKTPSGTASNYKLVESGSSQYNTSYKIEKYYVSEGQIFYIKTTADGAYQFQNAWNVPTGTNTNVIGQTHTGAIDNFIIVPEGATYVMVSMLTNDTTSGIYVCTIQTDEYKNYINKDSQTVFIPEYPIYMEKDDANSYLYLYCGSWYIRSALSKTFNISMLDDTFTLQTSPSGITNCIKIPYGYSIVYDIVEQTLSLASSYTQYTGYNHVLIGYFSTSGNLLGGLLYERWLLERINDTYNIPDYYSAYLSNKTSAINAAIATVGKQGFTFAFVTDPHINYNSGNTPKIIKKLNDLTRFKYVFNGGDIIDVESTKTAALDRMADYVGEYSFLNQPMFMIMGNHDYNTETSQAVQGENITVNEFYGVAMRQMQNVTYFDNYLDYYFVDEASDTAVICLQTGVNNGSYHLNQNDAIATILPTLPNNVIIIGHLFAKTENGSIVTNANYNTLVNGTTAQPGLNGMANKTKIKAIICGHTHGDWSTFQDGFRLIVTDTDSYKSNTSNKGTINEIAFDVMTFDFANNSVKCTRIGRGNDRTLSLTT